MKKIKIRPEEARELQQEIDGYLRCMAVSESMFDQSPTRFEVRLLKALSERDADFFRMLAKLCEIGTNRWHSRQKDEPEIRHIAIQSKRWLEANHKPVNRVAIRKLTISIWSAIRAKFEADGVFVRTQQAIFESVDGPIPISFTTERPAGIWSESDYITALQLELEGEEGATLRGKLDKEACRFPGFPEAAFKRVWQDPELRDVEKGKSVSHRGPSRLA